MRRIIKLFWKGYVISATVAFTLLLASQPLGDFMRACHKIYTLFQEE